MQWDYDDRGNAIDLQITYREIVRRGWHGKKSDRIPPIWRDVVERTIREHHRQQELQELQSRFGSGAGQRKAQLRERLAGADAQTRARLREQRERM